MAQGQGSKSRRRKSFPGDRGLTVGFKDVQFIHEASLGDTSFSLADLKLPQGSGSFQNPNPSTVADMNLEDFRQNIEVYSSLAGKLALGLSYEVSGTLILLKFEAEEGEVFFGTIRNGARAGSDFIDGEAAVTTGFLNPGETTFNVGFDYKIGDNPNENIGALRVTRQRVEQFRNSNITSGSDGDYSEVRAGNEQHGTTIEFNEAGETLPDGNPEFVTVEHRKIFADNEQDSLRQLTRVQAGQILRMAETLAQVVGKPVTDFISASPTVTQLKAFGDRVLDLTSRVTTLENGGTKVAQVEGEGSGGESITGGTDNIVWNEVKDTHGAWNDTQYTVQQNNSTITVVGHVQFTTSAERSIEAYVNGTQLRKVNESTSSENHHFVYQVTNLNQGDVISFRPRNNGGTLVDGNVEHYISITEQWEA